MMLSPHAAAVVFGAAAAMPVDGADRDRSDTNHAHGCREGDCALRLGQRWTEERLLGVREPRLRADSPRDALRVVWPSPGEPMAVARALDELRLRCDSAAHPAEAACHG